MWERRRAFSNLARKRTPDSEPAVAFGGAGINEILWLTWNVLMRISCAIALLLVAAGCQRTGIPPSATVIAAPAAAISATTPLPATLPIVKATSHKKKASSSVLGMRDRTESRTSNRNDAYNDGDPCADLTDSALDDCIARDDSGPTNSVDNNDDPSLDRPELEPRDRELISAEDAAARDRELTDTQDIPPEDQAPDYSPQDDYPPPEDDSAPEDYPPDEDSDQPPPDDPYNQ
jgi:hypothetical protein